MSKRTAMTILSAMTGTLCSCATPGFVTVSDGRFVLRGRTHAFVGVNFWQAMNLAVDAPAGDRDRLRAELDRLRELGITNLRVMAASEGPNSEPHRMTPALMVEPGQYDERVMTGLDFLIAELAIRDMRAVLVLNNFWEWSGGMAQYVSWHEKSPIPYPADYDWRVYCDYAARFYSYAACQRWYLDHIETIVTRVNPLTGRAYRDEPAIFAWELANEPRYYPANWVEDTARFIRSLDPNHLITVGSEGNVGGDFVATHASPVIDYTTIHIWPQNWGWYDAKKPETFERAIRETRSYLERHVAEATDLHKPLVIEEFGLARDWEPLHDGFDPASPTTLRDQFFAMIFDSTLASVSTGGPIAGVNLWAWSGSARPGDAWVGDPPHEKPGWYSVYDGDASTLELIARQATELQRRLRSRPSSP